MWNQRPEDLHRGQSDGPPGPIVSKRHAAFDDDEDAVDDPLLERPDRLGQCRRRVPSPEHCPQRWMRDVYLDQRIDGAIDQRFGGKARYLRQERMIERASEHLRIARKSVVEGKSVSVRVEFWGCSISQKK